MNPTVELVFDEGCPHVAAARENLRCALESLGRAPTWRELVSSSPDLPEHARGWGSPTILVNGRDVAARERRPELGGPSCRVYRDATGRSSPAPTVEQILAALASGDEPEGRF